ncbi:MAG: demethoxyubiquinone hydroxylase family protein [Alphaproteobacteria bacterium]|nr:demethoxyubiquinone hydroxylase family protein [Alphaproteobacteria bacterium]
MTTLSDRRKEMLRVDHAGEYGAVAIYRGQLAVFRARARHARISGQIEHMAGQEQDHLDTFDQLLVAGRVRPTIMSPLWNAAGFALGAATALLGEKAAYACTEAVETVIEQHYGDQLAELKASGETELAVRLTKFRDDEIAHRDLAADEGAAEAPGYAVLSALIRTGCRIAIRISEKV